MRFIEHAGDASVFFMMKAANLFMVCPGDQETPGDGNLLCPEVLFGYSFDILDSEDE